MSQDFLSKIRDKMSGFSDQIDASRGKRWRPPRQRQREATRQIVKHTRFDLLDWRDARQDEAISDGIKDVFLGDINNPEDRPPYLNAPELFQDLFMCFLKPVPTLQKKRDVKKDARLNGKFIEQMMALPEYERLHDQTLTDPMLSTMATGLVVDAVKEMIKQHREQVKDANERRQNSDDPHPNPPPGAPQPGESWDEETPGQGQGQGQGQGSGKQQKQDKKQKQDKSKSQDGGQQQQQSPGATDGKGESQFDKDAEKEDGGEGEEQEPQDENTDDADDQEDKEQEQPDEADDEAEDEKQDPWGDPKDEQGQGGDGEGEGEEGEDDGRIDNIDRAWDEAYEEALDRAEMDDEANLDAMLDSCDFARSLNKVLGDTADDMDELTESVKSVGLSPEEWKQMDPKRRLQIAEKLNNPRMKAIADMVGRMKRFAMAQQAQKIIDAPHEIFDVEIGKDLRRVLRTEYMWLGTPETKIEFYRRFINGELLQFKERGREDVGKGPIICCIDNSGSMSGEPENWAKGVAEALRRICAEQKRDFHAIYFETNSHRERFDFPKETSVDFEKVLKFLSISAGGGTEFDGVLTEALAKCETRFTEAGETKADVVFITDGEAFLNEDWIKAFNEKRASMGVRIFGVYISAYDSTRSSACRLLEKFCDIVLPVKALAVQDDAAARIFANV